jgi:integrase
MARAANPRKSNTARTAAKRRNVKSVPVPMPDATTDAHERRKDYLTQTELDAFLAAARHGRHGVRDHALMLMKARHGFRVSELIDLRMDDLDLTNSKAADMAVNRLKGSTRNRHPIEGDELRALKAWLKLRPANSGHDNVFLNERRQPFTRQAVNYLVAEIAARAGLPHVNPHMLRHTSGFLLADRNIDLRTIQEWLGHRDPANTARYTRISAAKFRGLHRRKGKP